MEKPRQFDPVGHTRLPLLDKIKMTPVVCRQGNLFVVLGFPVLARRGLISKPTEYDGRIKKHPAVLRIRDGDK